MNNGYEVIWSDKATSDFDEIVQYLSNDWNDDAVRNFVRAIDKDLARISMFPYAYPVSAIKPKVRRCVVSKINTIYYTVKERTVYIITIYDNRRNPNRLKQIL